MNYQILHAAGLAGLFALFPASCAKPIDLCADEAGACLTVQVTADDASGQLTGQLIDRLRTLYTLDAAGQQERDFAGPAEAPDGSVLPLAFALTLPKGGAVHLDVIAEQKLIPTLRGSADVTLADNEHQQVAVTLSPDVTALPFLGPPPRHHAGMVYFPPRQSVVLFGGVDSNGALLADTWELDPASGAWTARAGTGPAARQATLVYDPMLKRLVLAGGAGANGQPISDLWSYDANGTWTQEPGNRGGGNRTGAGITITDAGVAVLYGGVDSAGTVLQDLLTFDPSTKLGTDFLAHPISPTNLRVKSPRLVSTSVPAAGSVFLLGADLASPNAGIGIWQLSGNFSAAGTAIVATPIAAGDPSAPSRRSDFAVAADGAAGLIYLFGGTADPTAEYLPDAYVFSTTAKQWTRLSATATPLARAGAQLAWTPSAVRLQGGLAAPPSPLIPLDAWNLTIGPFTAPALPAVFTRRP